MRHTCCEAPARAHYSRTAIFRSTDKCVIASGGCFTDIATLHKVLAARIDTYRHDHDVDMGCTALAQMLSTTLYSRRFFPYYAFNLVAGLDAAGKGAVFTYDAVGSYERVQYAAQVRDAHACAGMCAGVVGPPPFAFACTRRRARASA